MIAATTAKRPVLRERDIVAQIKAFLESRGWYAVRLQSGTVRGVTRGTYMRLGAKGLPDWCFVRAREALFVEVKRPGGKPSQDQARWLEWAAVQGIQAIVADGLVSFMDRYGKLFAR